MCALQVYKHITTIQLYKDIRSTKAASTSKKKIILTQNDHYKASDLLVVSSASSSSVDMAEEAQVIGVKDQGAELALFDPSRKKKKKKPVVFQDLVEETEILPVSEVGENSFVGEDEKEYWYEDLLDNLLNKLCENNPELATNRRRRLVLRPPQVLTEHNKKTIFLNFMELCNMMHRRPEHVMAFLLAELGTSGSLDGLQRLVVKGNFASKGFEVILQRYAKQYVTCNACKSSNTIISKENRLFFLRCEECGAEQSIEPIKAGFVADVESR